MKTRKILAASTAALLSFASVAVVASAANGDISNWTALDDDPGEFVELLTDELSFKVTSKDAKKLEGIEIGAASLDEVAGTAKAGDTAASVDWASGSIINADEDIKASVKAKILAGFGVEDDGTVVGEAYNISVKFADGDDYVPEEDLKLEAGVTIRIEECTVKGDVYHITGGKAVKVDAKRTVKHGDTDVYAYEFTTKSFSPFVIVPNAIKGAVSEGDADTSDDSAASDGESGAENGDNANTGIALAIAPVVLAAGAVAVVALKKKH